MAETEFTIVRTGGDKEASDKLYAGMNPMTAEDLADLFWWLANLPPHLNINTRRVDAGQPELRRLHRQPRGLTKRPRVFGRPT